MTFDTDNPRKVGVRFDSSVPGGNSLGGACENGFGTPPQSRTIHANIPFSGFFVETAELRVENDNVPSFDYVVLDTLFELAVELSASQGPLILFLPDAEKVRKLVSDT